MGDHAGGIMEADRATYEKTVRDHLVHRRQMVSIVTRENLSPLAEQQNQILGTDLIHWSNEVANDLLSERALLGKMQG
jgi:hypothetical protein